MKKNKIINNKIKHINRLIYLIIIILISYLGYFTIYKNNYYKYMLNSILNTSYTTKNAPRGRIYDRNYNLLVDNKLVPVIYYLKPNKISSSDEIKIANKLSNLIDIDYSKESIRILKDYYLTINNSDELITEEEWDLLDKRKINNNDIYNMKLERIDNSIFDNYSEEEKESAYIYYLMNNGFSYELKTIKEKGLTNQEISNICDNYDDLNGIILDYNYERVYLYGDTLRSILGNISTIPYEEKDNYLKNGYELSDLVGISYLEKQYEKYLKGEKGKYKIENNSIIKIEDSKRGKDIVLTIDINLQQEIDKILEEGLIDAKNDPNTSLFNSAYVVIKDPKNGDILAISGKGIKKEGNNYVPYDLTTGVLTNSMTPGSVVKGASILVGYKENAIDIGQEFNDNCVKLYSFPEKCSWKKLGVVNDIKALSLSSNIYQFKTALKVANIDYSYNIKVNDVKEAFDKYRAFFKEIGLGDKSGIDLPIDDIGGLGKSNSPDLYLNYVIGQYDTYTTMQLSEYISTIANYGERVRPHLLLEVRNNDNNEEIGSLFLKYTPTSTSLSVDKKYIDRVRLGFNEVMKTGLGRNYMGDIDNPSGKTGTSESFYDSNNDGIIDTPTVSNAFVGYYPSDTPEFSIAITFPNIMRINGSDENRSYANKEITRNIVKKYLELHA